MELADAFDCSYRCFDFSRLNVALRLLLSSFMTLREVFRSRWCVIFSQYPSLPLNLLLSFCSIFSSFKFVVDAHNVAIEDFQKSASLRGRLVAWVFSRADHIVVSNSALVSKLGKYADKALVLADRLPQIEPSSKPSLVDNTEMAVTLIASFAPDEPIEEFIKGFNKAKLADGTKLFVTGRRSRAGGLIGFESERVVFTDFLGEGEFEALIQHSILLVDLTTREDCLVCGAYEALSVEVPILLSSSEALRTTFPLGTVFSNNSQSDFSEALEHFFEDVAGYKERIGSMKEDFALVWQEQFEKISNKISN